MKIENYRQGDVLPQFGRAFQVKSYRGKLYVAKWPKARGKNLPPLTKLRNQWFKLANILSNNTSPGQMRTAMKMAPHGALYPRDYLVSAMSGRLYDIALEDGTRLYPMSLANEISKDLDVIAQVKGQFMYRGAQLWQPLHTITEEGSIYLNQDTGLPVWEPFGPKVGPHTMTSLPWTSASSAASATVGWSTVLTASIRVSRMQSKMTPAFGHTFQGVIARLSGTTVAEIIAVSNTYTAPNSSPQIAMFDFSDTPTLDKGTTYFFGCTRTDSTSTAQPKVWSGTIAGSFNFPSSVTIGWHNYSSNPLAVSDTPATGGTGFNYANDLIYRM